MLRASLTPSAANKRYIFVILFLAGVTGSIRAQISGTVSFGAEATNNVQALDTIAPDHTLLPALELDYDAHPSGVSTITLSGSLSPEYYALNPALSYNQISFGATAVVYLSNQSSIAAQANSEGSDLNLLPFSRSYFQQGAILGMQPQAAESLPQVFSDGDSTTRNDSLVDLAESALYALSGELDSTEISPKGIPNTRLSAFEDLRDSISNVLSTIADLLDSIGYSESTSVVLVGELQNLRAPLAALMPHTRPFHTDPRLLDRAIDDLESSTPESEFLPTPAMPSAAASGTKVSPRVRELIKESTQVPALSVPLAPKLTLIESDERLRTFGADDVDILEDDDDSDATTMALALTVPVAYTTHSGIHYSPSDTLLFGANFGGNPNDSRELSFGAALEGLTSTNFSLRGSYDYTRTSYAFDSVYANTENRFRLLPRFSFGGSFVIFPEASIGFRNYLTPLTVVDTITPERVVGKKIIPANVKTLTAGSNFSQFSYGIGVMDIIGERWALGALVAFNENPNLRAYVTTAALAKGANGRAVRAAVQIADDEFTYNLSRYAVISEARIWWDLDFGADVSYEHRIYGSEVGPKGNTLPGGQGRKENGRYANVSLSRLWALNDRLAGVFNAFKLEALWQLADVTATQAIYSYSASNFTLTATLGF